MTKMIVKEVDGMWAVKWIGDKAKEIKELFNTDTILTPYSSSYPKHKVIEELKRKNPSYIVE